MKESTAENEVCLALGYFDSVHLGHRRLIETAGGFAHSKGIASAVATFTNNAYKVFNRDEKVVYTYAERTQLLNGLCDYVLPMRFDKRLKDCTAEHFLDALTAKYRIRAIVCGYDYLFGAGAEGDAEFLKNYCDVHGLDCVIVDKLEYDGVRVSTSEVKHLLADGQIERANTFLGEPFMMCGKVVAGRGAGRMFDIPTANLKIPVDKIIPKRGVYGTECVIDGKTYCGATNVGGRPTFDLTKIAIETMICDFSDNIYDKEIKLYFYKYLRPVTKFDTPKELSEQVHKDIHWSNENA